MHFDAMDGGPIESCARLLLSCLGEASRYRLVQALAGQERCVGELAVAVGLSQSCTTRHLQALERAGVVRSQRDGRKVRFRLRDDDPALEPLLAWALASAGTQAVGAVAGGRGPEPPRPAPIRARRAPPSAHREDRPRVGPEHPGRSMDAPTDGEAGGSGPASHPRTSDLEDYLL
jgi:DNA-binding transcriptional ArsR family regulator